MRCSEPGLSVAVADPSSCLLAADMIFVYIRAEIGPRRKRDDPRLTLAISDATADVTAISGALNEWLTNTKSGRVTSREQDSEVSLLHVELGEPVRARQMVDRAIRKFNLTHSAKLYSYNEGRRYTTR